jgi:UDP-glucose:(glucosyl)LPS alpha-1,2-glucosyltransferase
MPIETNELSKNANGGTEIMQRKLEQVIDPALLDQFQIIPSRVRTLDESKVRILWCHDLAGDPEADNAFKKIGHNSFHKIVFVSNWQMQSYIQHYDIPWHKCVVLQNAIEPINFEGTKDYSKFYDEKSKDKINLIYHTTPHRGLNILVPVFKKLTEKYDNLHLDVFSSFKVYGWDERDKQFEPLYDEIRSIPQATYHGAVSNQEVKEALKTAHIYAYPSVWLETSCISLIEAMSGGLVCVHPNYGALFETAANWTQMYQWQEDMQKHANMLYSMLDSIIPNLNSDSTQAMLMGQKGYTDMFYNWEVRAAQWKNLLEGLVNEPREIPKTSGAFFTYRS